MLIEEISCIIAQKHDMIRAEFQSRPLETFLLAYLRSCSFLGLFIYTRHNISSKVHYKAEN